MKWNVYDIATRALVSIALAALVAPLATRADDNPEYLSGPWHYRAMSCVDTTVISVTPRLGNPGQTTFPASQFKETGVEVTYATGLGLAPLYPGEHAEVVHYQDTAGNDIMAAEHKGDKVQVCFINGPAPTQYCNPDKDDRGRNFRVWDYQQKKQYWGINSEHDCGGA